MDEKLEIIKLLRGQTLDDMYKINIILIHLNEMVDKGIITREDVDNISTLPKFKQEKIIQYVSSKVKKYGENNNGKRNNNKGAIQFNSFDKNRKKRKRQTVKHR